MSEVLFLENLRYLRKINKISQEEMAEKLNIKRSTYSQFESKSKSIETIARLRDVIYSEFGYTLDELFNVNLETKEKVIFVEEQLEKDFLTDSFLGCLTEISKRLNDVKFDLIL